MLWMLQSASGRPQSCNVKILFLILTDIALVFSFLRDLVWSEYLIAGSFMFCKLDTRQK